MGLATNVLNNSIYSPVGDILVMAIIGIFLILIRAAFIKQTKEFRIFRHALITLLLAAIMDILYHVFLANIEQAPSMPIYIFRFLYHFLLFEEFVLYVRYFEYTLQMTRKWEKSYWFAALAGFIVFSIVDILGSVLKFGFYITEDKMALYGLNLFPFQYFF